MVHLQSLCAHLVLPQSLEYYKVWTLNDQWWPGFAGNLHSRSHILHPVLWNKYCSIHTHDFLKQPRKKIAFVAINEGPSLQSINKCIQQTCPGMIILKLGPTVTFSSYGTNKRKGEKPTWQGSERPLWPSLASRCLRVAFMLVHAIRRNEQCS